MPKTNRELCIICGSLAVVTCTLWIISLKSFDSFDSTDVFFTQSNNKLPFEPSHWISTKIKDIQYNQHVQYITNEKVSNKNINIDDNSSVNIDTCCDHLSDPVTLVITSCGRWNLLLQTILSFEQ